MIAVRAALASSRTRHVLGRYLTVGAVVAVVDFTTLRIGLVAGLAAWLATSLAYVVSTAFHFTLNKLFTFRDTDATRLHRQIAIYLAVVLACYLSTIAIVVGLVHLGVSPYVGKALAIAVNVPLGFACNRAFTFGRR